MLTECKRSVHKLWEERKWYPSITLYFFIPHVHHQRGEIQTQDPQPTRNPKSWGESQRVLSQPQSQQWENSSSIVSDHQRYTQQCPQPWNIDKWDSISVLKECVCQMGHQIVKYNKEKRSASFEPRLLPRNQLLPFISPFWIPHLTCLSKSRGGFELRKGRRQDQTNRWKQSTLLGVNLRGQRWGGGKRGRGECGTSEADPVPGA